MWTMEKFHALTKVVCFILSQLVYPQDSSLLPLLPTPSLLPREPDLILVFSYMTQVLTC